MALTIRGLDYAYGRPNYAELHRQGYRFVMRYLSSSPNAHPNNKDLDPAELKAILRAGLDIGLVWETSANEAMRGYAQGQADARNAKAEADRDGLHDIPIYFAVDFPAAGPEVVQYFRGVVSVLGKARTGVYGGYNVVSYLFARGVVTYYWQTLAWSAGRVHPHIHIYQSGVPRTIAGVNADPDLGRSDFSIGTRGPNQQRPIPYASRKLKIGSHGSDVKLFQAYLNVRLRHNKGKPIAVDGTFGPATQHARTFIMHALGFPKRSINSQWTWPRAQRIIKNPKRRPAGFWLRAAARRGK